MMQFRFHGENSELNYPPNMELTDWKFNLLLNYGAVSHLGIQGEPGVRFYLNGGDNPITLGHTGIYELDLSGVSRITGLRFDDTLTATYNNSFNETHRLIVDIVYDGLEVVV